MKKRGLFLSIGFKLTGIVSILLGLSLGGLTALSTWSYSNDIERTLRSSTMERVELLSASIDTTLSAYIKNGRLVAATMVGGLVYEGTGANATGALLAQNPDLLAVRIVSLDEAGAPMLRASSIPGFSPDNPAGTDPSAASLLSAVRSGLARPFAGETAIFNLSPESASPVLGIAFPFTYRAEGEADTVVLLTVSMDTLVGSLASRELYSNYLVDSSGTLIAHTDENLVLARPSLAGDEIVRDSMSGASTTKQMQTTGEDGSVLIGSYCRFFGDSLTVISTINKDVALEGVLRLQQRNILISVMILCASIFLLFFFSKSLTNPVKRLMDGAAKIGSGDFSVRIPPTSRDEIGRLSETFNAMTEGLAERDKIKNAFGKFVNKEVAERVMKGDVQLGGESRTAAIFFSDIRSFTAISEQLTPHEVVEFLNEYLTIMVDCVNRTNGVVDKFIGDAIMAIWGVPYSHGNDTENAINSALKMRMALAAFNLNRGTPSKPIIRIGSGINTGEVIAGQIGSPERMEYTCIGDAVNLASRIESLNKLFHTDILISEHSYELVKTIFRVEPMKQIRVKGKAVPQQIYAVLGRYDDHSSFQTIADLRAFLGIEAVHLDEVNPDIAEEKYEIVE